MINPRKSSLHHLHCNNCNRISTKIVLLKFAVVQEYQKRTKWKIDICFSSRGRESSYMLLTYVLCTITWHLGHAQQAYLCHKYVHHDIFHDFEYILWVWISALQKGSRFSADKSIMIFLLKFNSLETLLHRESGYIHFPISVRLLNSWPTPNAKTEMFP